MKNIAGISKPAKQAIARLPALFFLLAVFVWDSAQAHPGIGIVMDRAGNLFYTDLAHVWKITPDGRKSVAVSGVHTHELYLDESGNLHGEHLWAEDGGREWKHYVWKLSSSGKLETSETRRGFREEISFVRDAQGNMYSFAAGANPAFVRRSPTGVVTRLGENAAYRDVRWSTATRDGEIYFTDDGALRRLAKTGEVTTLAPNIKEQPGDWVGGVWLDGQGRIYVAVWGARMVKRYDPVQKRLEVVARSSTPWGPSGGMVARNGDLWLLETSQANTVRVRRIAANGAETIY